MDEHDYDPMDGDGDEYYCCECGEYADPAFALKHDGMCEECVQETDEEWRADREDDRYNAQFDDDLIDGVGFADPGGNSALRAATIDNPRVHPCPTCGTQNVLTPADVRRGYQCDRCADQDECGF